VFFEIYFNCEYQLPIVSDYYCLWSLLTIIETSKIMFAARHEHFSTGFILGIVACTRPLLIPDYFEPAFSCPVAPVFEINFYMTHNIISDECQFFCISTGNFANFCNFISPISLPTFGICATKHTWTKAIFWLPTQTKRSLISNFLAATIDKGFNTRGIWNNAPLTPVPRNRGEPV